MANYPRHHLPPTDHDDGTARHLTRQEFARRLSSVIMERGWSQSDLARAAGLGRDAISTYVRGRSLPGPLNLRKLADALGMSPHQLLPNAAENAVDNDVPAFEMRAAVGHPDQVWVRLNRQLTLRQALAIARVLDAESADEGESMACRYLADATVED